VLSIPLIRCDNRIFNRVIEQEVIEDQVFNRSIKEEYIGELGHKNDRQLLQTGYDLNLYHSVTLNFIYNTILWFYYIT